jgi:hypothetical protein
MAHFLRARCTRYWNIIRRRIAIMKIEVKNSKIRSASSGVGPQIKATSSAAGECAIVAWN